MAQNNRVTLIGNLGDNPKKIEKEGKTFVTLSLCTQDSYKQGEEWKEKDPIWHKVLVFGNTAQGYAQSYQKGTRIKVTGSLAYRAVTSAEGGFFSFGPLLRGFNEFM